MSLENRLRKLVHVALFSLSVACSSCIINDEPKARIGSYASKTIATVFQGIKDLGSHGFFLEGNGQVYCCNAGHIDIAHLRKSADWTICLGKKSYNHLMNDDSEFSFKFKEPSRYFVKISYPEYWRDLPKKGKENTAKEISVKLGQYLAYTGVTWHEILTWFGYKSSGFYPEFPSAFSWEDSFSNNLGVYLAGEVLNENKSFNKSKFNKSMTSTLEKELKKLNVQSKKVSENASEKMRGKWYFGDFIFTEITKRNFDIGLNGEVTPFLIPNINECEEAEAVSYPVPDSDFSRYGFSVRLEIEPREWEKRKILNIVKRENRIYTDDFPFIMDYIKKEAVKRYGSNVASLSE